MLNVVQWVLSEEGYGEKDVVNARDKVRRSMTNISNGYNGSGLPLQFDLPLDEEEELRERSGIPDDVPLLPPAPPPMIPQDGPNPFPGLDPPVG